MKPGATTRLCPPGLGSCFSYLSRAARNRSRNLSADAGKREIAPPGRNLPPYASCAFPACHDISVRQFTGRPIEDAVVSRKSVQPVIRVRQGCSVRPADPARLCRYCSSCALCAYLGFLATLHRLKVRRPRRRPGVTTQKFWSQTAVPRRDMDDHHRGAEMRQA